MKTKLWDVKMPTDNWGKNYAHMEYKRIGWYNLWHYITYIEVNYE